ncbi:hypothetical protein GWI33_018812 [Rhynchophorus ferrugineus]|uniref:Uncharacterized protein n=1 Tax=Rhynchophorus ferrugineus TaxID=354439 RepID=A0A834HX56_RHYFE|nr:hypothetical protein GWI33_018812 [Rhynchophorus ferrugineus]
MGLSSFIYRVFTEKTFTLIQELDTTDPYSKEGSAYFVACSHSCLPDSIRKKNAVNGSKRCIAEKASAGPALILHACRYPSANVTVTLSHAQRYMGGDAVGPGGESREH